MIKIFLNNAVYLKLKKFVICCNFFNSYFFAHTPKFCITEFKFYAKIAQRKIENFGGP